MGSRLVLAAFASLLFEQAVSPQPPAFRRHAIDGGANESVAVADVNRDGRLDIIAGENWFEAPAWKKHHIREIPFINGYIDDLSNFALDCNADGYPDVIASSWFSKKMSWYENPGAAGGGALWKEHVIESGFNYELILPSGAPPGRGELRRDLRQRRRSDVSAVPGGPRGPAHVARARHRGARAHAARGRPHRARDRRARSGPLLSQDSE